MSNNQLTVRKMEAKELSLVTEYFYESNDEFLESLGTTRSTLPSSQEWEALVEEDMKKPLKDRTALYVLWLLNDKPIGHAFLHNIKYAENGFMYMHLWNKGQRNQGLGLAFVFKTLPIFYDTFELKSIICESKADNKASTKILEKAKFERLYSYEKTPAWINIPQLVNRFELTAERFKNITA